MARKETARQRKLITMDAGLLAAVAEYSRESGDRFDEIFELALRAFLKSKGQPVSLHEALEQSTKLIAANDRQSARSTTKKRKPRS
jgi:hypothetical protein